MASLVGRVVAEYRLDSSLGTGAVGETFRGVHRRTAAAAAIKVVYGRLTTDGGFADRFRRQLAVVSTVRSGHVLPITSTGQDEGQFFIISDLMPGGSLRGLLQRRAQELPLWRGLEIVRQAAEGVVACHVHGVWHGDLKPENVLLDRELPASAGKPEMPVVRVADAGLTKLAESGATVGGFAAFGSPVYLSPEQCRGADIDGRSDVYSLGVVLYEVVTGFPPFQIRTLGDAIEKHLNTAPPPPRSVAPTVPEAIDALVLRCLAKRPEDRYQSASDLALAIQTIAQQIGIPVRPAVVLRPEPPKVKLRDERPKVVLRDDPTRAAGRGSSTKAGGPPDSPVRVLFRGQPAGSGPSKAEPSGGGQRVRVPPTPPTGPRADQMTSADVPLNVVRRPTVPERRPSALPPDIAEQAGGAGPARRSRRITLAVEPEAFTLTPGMPVIVRVTIANTGHIVDHFPVTVEGVPDGWVELPHKPAQLIPGARTTVPLKVLVPRACAHHAGEYHPTIRVQSRDKPEESTVATGRWTVVPFAATSVTLAPQRVQAWRRAKYQATIANDGNAVAEYAFSAADEEQKLRCKFSPAKATLTPCGRQTVTMSAVVPIRWIGTNQSRAFTVRAQRVVADGRATPQEAPAVAQGQFVHRAVIPAWVPPLLAILAVALVMLLRTRTTLHLTVTPPSAQVAIGSTVPLSAAVVDAHSEVVPNHLIGWRSRDSTVASVTDSGVVLGRREGQTEIMVASGRMESAVTVMVVAARVEAISITPKALELKIGTTTVLRATAKDAHGGVLPRDVMWTSSDPTVATVGGNGRVTAKAAGTATITAMADNKSGTADVTIPAPPVTAAGPAAPSAPTEDCVAYDPAALHLVDEKASGWGLSDGSRDIATLDNQTDAGRALGLARAYKRHCFLGRGNGRPARSDYIIEYWDGPSGLPTKLDVEDCQPYDRASLRIQEVSGQGWMLTDGKLRLTMADTQADAKHAWDTALQNNQFCFIGRGNRRPNHRDYVVQYWKR